MEEELTAAAAYAAGRRRAAWGDHDANKDTGKAEKEKEICNLWNNGKKPCGGKTTCTFGRLHVCRKCKGPHTEDKCDGSGNAGAGKRKGRGSRNRRGHKD